MKEWASEYAWWVPQIDKGKVGAMKARIKRHPRSSTVGMAPKIRQRRRQVKEVGKSDADPENG